MNYKNFGQVSQEIDGVMDILIEDTSPYKRKLISNVSLCAMVMLFRSLPPCKRLYLPGEAHSEKMIIIYKPAENCSIVIQSEPLYNHSVKLQIKQINLN